jgi:transposase
MLIVGCDYHPSFQQIAWVDSESRECAERSLIHSNEEAERFWRVEQWRGALKAIDSQTAS